MEHVIFHMYYMIHYLLTTNRLLMKKNLVELVELAEVERLKAAKYDTWEWNFGASPRYGVENRRKWDGGILEARLQVEHGCITHAAFYGDFLALCSMDAVTAALVGTPYRREDVEAVLRPFPLEQYFGTITLTEVLDTMFAPSEGEK